MEEALFEIGIKALIVNGEGKILLLKAGEEEKKYENVDFWDLPGGRIQGDETIEETLRREIEEELGIDGRNLIIKELFDATISTFKIRKEGKQFGLMLIVYRCELPPDAKFDLSKEHFSYGWISVGEAGKLLSTKFDNGFIKRLKLLKG
jgi:8-oxo-dGTP pyrophosphatase MutT (NUDIX family)